MNKIFKALSFIPGLIQAAEFSFGKKQGDSKKQQVSDIIDSIVGVIDSGQYGEIIDPKLFKEGKDEMIEAALKCLKATKGFKELEGK